MRRNWIIALMGAAMFAVMPATALAHGHHAKRHHGVKMHVRHLRAAASGASGTPSTPGSRTDSAGTVTSFDGTTLVITLTNGSTVSGAVTSDTRLGCESASQPTPVQSDMSFDGGPQGGSGDQGTSSGGSDDQGGSNDQGDDGGNQTACTTANLTPGTVVHEADLKLSSAGSVWEKVDLITG